MISFKNIFHDKAGSVCCGLVAALVALPVFTSCEDFFAQESDDVLYADQEHLNAAEDTIYSVTGILTKLQSIADRTILLGELRGDLVDLTNEASNDLREVFEFNVGDDNIYNNPSDYYAVINNCNYFIAHADTALKDIRNESVFMKEYAAVKAIRAWTYLQLVLNYGSVPFYTEPMLSKEAAEAAENGTKADLAAICDYFINDLQNIPERYNRDLPGYRVIRGVESRLLFFPLSIVRGDLYLWKASVTQSKEDYKQAALHYYKYISERNGTNSAYPTGKNNYIWWEPGEASWLSPSGSIFPISESIADNAELITMIAGDSIRAEGHYSELRNLFTSREENDYKVSITPSTRMVEISESQPNCVLSSKAGTSIIYAPKGLNRHHSGDLRLQDVWYENTRIDPATNTRIETQYIYKYSSQRNVHIYRRMMVYLRMAEALNCAGYPHMAYQILAQGLSNRVINNQVIPYYHASEEETSTLSDSLFLARFDFPDERYAVCTVNDFTGAGEQTHNMMGIHARGCGWTPMDTTYVLPHDTLELDLAKRSQLIAEQQAVVDSLLLTENALELAFEGTRYYDLMRFALRKDNPGEFLSTMVGRRNSQSAGVAANLRNRNNWYLRWKGKIGM
jgi:hypothetical protein